MKEEKKNLDWSPAPEDVEDMKADGQWLEPGEGYYDDGSYVNFGWVGTLSTVLLVLGTLLLVAGIISTVWAFDDTSGEAFIIAASLLISGLMLLLGGGATKVLMQIERNTRL